ncbi:twin-arginine translocase TatA/TatE family subunit [Finegoldia magna]|uniref:twin-arginine translocase TatA/TatE family subunit n=1 Tax=Finegoldia magna TaxID=1260 RepID=UPI0027BAF9B5|nr:twin-arginine translocase TatA/TatE family subunit [Finegoldia magna]
MFSRIGPTELILILVIALIIFGPAKLPEIGKAIGSAINEFKNSVNTSSKDDDKKEDK